MSASASVDSASNGAVPGKDTGRATDDESEAESGDEDDSDEDEDGDEDGSESEASDSNPFSLKRTLPSKDSCGFISKVSKKEFFLHLSLPFKKKCHFRTYKLNT